MFMVLSSWQNTSRVYPAHMMNVNVGTTNQTQDEQKKVHKNTNSNKTDNLAPGKKTRKNVQRIQNSKLNLDPSGSSTPVRTASNERAQLWYTIQHGTVLVIFPLIHHSSGDAC